MLMVATDPMMLVANLQDGLGQDPSAPGRAEAFLAEGRGNLRIRIARPPQLLCAVDHRVIAGAVALVHDRRNDYALREMATHPDDLDRNAIGGGALDNHAGNEAPEQGLALVVAQLIARPEGGKMLAEVEQLLADCWRQRRLTGLLGKTLRSLLSLPEGAEFVIPCAFEFGSCQTVGWIDLLVAAPGQRDAEARLTHLLLMIRGQTLALPLALRHDLVQRLQLRGRDGLEKGLDHERLDRGPIEMGTPRFGEGAVHTRAEVARAGTIGHMHPMPAAAAGGKSLQQGSALT